MTNVWWMSGVIGYCTVILHTFHITADLFELPPCLPAHLPRHLCPIMLHTRDSLLLIDNEWELFSCLLAQTHLDRQPFTQGHQTLRDAFTPSIFNQNHDLFFQDFYD